MHLILTGATGLVGSAVLQHMIVTPSITKISVLSRRPVPQAQGHEKVDVVIHKDYTTYPSELLDKLKGAEGCVWAQGISATQVTKPEYERITLDNPLSAARNFLALAPSSPSQTFKFVYVSGEGTTTTPGRFTPYFAVIKGRAEAALLALSKESPALKIYSLRPGGVDPSQHKEVHEWIPKREGWQRMNGVLLGALRGVSPGLVSPTKDLAQVLTDLAAGNGAPLEGKGIEGEGRTISNVGMRRLAGL